MSDHTEDDLRRLLLEPPQVLQDMRYIYNGYAPETPGQIFVAAMKKDNPKEFLARLMAAEKDYRTEAARGVRGEGVVVVGTVEEGETDPVEEVIEDCLRRAVEGPKS